jgi:ABC-2 type transport system permease protein
LPAVIDALRRFFENAVIIFRALFVWFQLQTYLASKVVLPIQQLVFFSLLGVFAGGPSRVSYMVVGNAVFLVGLGGIYASATVGADRGHGTLALLLASPANRALNFLQRGVMHVGDGLLTVAIGLVCALVVFHVDFSRANWAALVASVLVAAVSSVSLGLLLGALTLGFVEIFLIANVLYFGLMVVAGVNYPPQLLPGWLQPVSLVVPFTRSIAGARSAIAGGSLLAIGPSLLVELLLGCAYALAGYLLLKIVERRAIRHGTLDLV